MPRCKKSVVSVVPTGRLTRSPRVEPATSPWGARISDVDFKKLIDGFTPRDQDDKFHISATQYPCYIHIIRAYSRREMYTLHIAVAPDEVGSSVKIAAITWEQNVGGMRVSEEYAKSHVVIMARGILKCDLEALPDYEECHRAIESAYWLANPRP